MIWEAWQWRSIHRAEDKAYDAAVTASDALTEVKYLQDAIERLVLVNRAMWDLLSAHAGVRDEQLADRVREIDLRDGKLDGKNRTAPRECPSCKRTLGKRRVVCLYCGAAEQKVDPFRTV